MNIFILSKDPKLAAEYHCDKHVVKMIVETAQLLSTALHELGLGNSELYKPTHINHPCAKWVRENWFNFNWTVLLLKYLLDEYTFRYNKVHKTTEVYNEILKLRPLSIEEPWKYISYYVCAMPEQYICPDVVQSYRNYYIYEKSAICTWKKRNIPHWWPHESANPRVSPSFT